MIPIIQEQVGIGSVIRSDEWAANKRLITIGFLHETVNQSTNFVDLSTAAQSQKIERYWKEGKTRFKLLRRLTNLMQSHLDEVAWRLNHRYQNILEIFLQDIKKY